MNPLFNNEFIKGMDLSSLIEVEEAGGRFYDGGVEGDAMEILKRHGMNLVRLRLWHTPYSADGVSYGAGGNDLERTIALAKRASKLGLPWLLDFHYSDFWADPSKQITPKAWQGMDVDELEQAVYDYTYNVLCRLRDIDLLPAMTAVGNEVTNGLLWPLGKAPDFRNIARFLNAGIRAVRAAAPGQPVMLHLDQGGNRELYESWFDCYFAQGGEDFDCVGMSFYPFWNGKMGELAENMRLVSQRLDKDIIVVETSTAYTLEDYAEYEQLSPEERKGMAANASRAAQVEYPLTVQGQCDFLRDLVRTIRAVPNGRGKGFAWWEPAWLPVPKSEWANKAALEYTGEQGPGGNEWANQTLFDYDGRALPALHLLKEL